MSRSVTVTAWRLAAALAVAVVASPAQSHAAAPQSPGPAPPGMAWVPGGEFTMGSDGPLARENEKPPHRVRVRGFWLDVAPVTNDEFARFVKATGYVTTAERAPDWEELRKQLPPGTPKPDASVLVPGSMVFTPTDGPVDLRQMANFWRWVPGASWNHPEGPDSDLAGRAEHPVVQVSWDDAVAYAEWAGKRLPTEAEWEFAARGGTSGTTYWWGDEFRPGGAFVANTWTGKFPYENTSEDGFPRTAPIRSFPANGYGLFDMGGNVWNWCSDWYRPDVHAGTQGQLTIDPKGPTSSTSSDHPYQVERVTKGGSFLCHESYCASYRPSARRGLPPDTGMSHVGFRCAKSVPETKPKEETR